MGNARVLVAKIRKYFGESEIELFYPPSFSNLFHPYITMFLGETVTLTPGIVSKYFCTSTLLDSLVAAHWAVLTHYSVYNSSFFRISILCSQNVSVTKSDQNFKEKDRMYLPASSLVLYCKGWSFVVQCASACPCLSNALLVLAKVGPCPSLSERTDAIWMESSLCGPSVCSGVLVPIPTRVPGEAAGKYEHNHHHTFTYPIIRLLGKGATTTTVAQNLEPIML